MPTGMRFGSNTAKITSNTGTDFSAFDAFTIITMVYNLADTGAAQSYWTTNISGGLGVDLSMYSDWSADTYGIGHAGGADADVLSVAVINAWRLFGWTKAAGTATPRLHRYDGSTWTHTNGDNSIAGFNTAITGLEIGDSTPFTPIGNQMEMVLLGVWSEDTATDAAFEALATDYSNMLAKANRQLFTSRSLISGGAMIDAGVGNSETSRSGITIGQQSIPQWIANLWPTGVEYVKEVGANTSTTSNTTLALTVAAGGVPVGDCIVVLGSCDNSGASGVATTISVADNSTQPGAANTYTLQTPQAIADPGAASAGQQGHASVCIVTRALLAGDTITITYGNNTTAKVANAQQFSGVHLSVPVLPGSYTTEDNQTGQAATVSATTTRLGQMVIAGRCVEGGTADTFNADTDTTRGLWTAFTRRGAGTTTAGATLNSVYKLPNDTGAQTWDGATMLGTARDHCGFILILQPRPMPIFYGRRPADSVPSFWLPTRYKRRR